MSADFLDTNVFVYLLDTVDERKHRRARAAVSDALRGDACISHQVVQETLNVITRKLTPPVTPQDARDFFTTTLEPLWTVMPSSDLYARALDVSGRYRFSFYDSLIVAAALGAGCTRLLSEDLQHGQVIDGLRIENPFAT